MYRSNDDFVNISRIIQQFIFVVEFYLALKALSYSSLENIVCFQIMEFSLDLYSKSYIVISDDV